MNQGAPFTVYEFFAGGGMARAGLGEGWRGLLANDFDALKARVYRDNWGGDILREGDVWRLEAADLPGQADLAWASSPCQDFSLAGSRAGLTGGRSSAFWGFWRLMEALAHEDRPPRVLVLENVGGLLSSKGGADFADLCGALAKAGYSLGAVELDASAFTPQSRPRVFVVACRGRPPATLAGAAPGFGHTPAVRRAQASLPSSLRRSWIWWRLPAPAARNMNLRDLLEPDAAVAWRTPAQTRRLMDQASPAHRARLAEAAAMDGRAVAAAFRRIRIEGGRKVQRAELRLDGLAGCLRTPGGGSSRQLLVVAEGEQVRSRLLTPREGARLMGLPEDYRLPPTATAAFQVIGDGVAVPVVRHLARALLEPLCAATTEPPTDLAADWVAAE